MRVIKDGPMRDVDRCCWWGVEGSGDCDTISGGLVGVEGRGSFFLFSKAG